MLIFLVIKSLHNPKKVVPLHAFFRGLPSLSRMRTRDFVCRTVEARVRMESKEINDKLLTNNKLQCLQFNN